jgi:hypothetical protein
MGWIYQTFVVDLRKRLKTLLLRPLVLFASISILLPTTAIAADYAYRTNADGELVLTLSGSITSFDGAAFLAAVNLRQPKIVELEGPGGDMLSATRIGVVIHERAIATHAIGTCRSACAFIWIAGASMLADEGVQIANHLPVATVGASEGIPHHKTVAIFGWYLGRLNLSVEMMDAFLNLATRYGTSPNEYFDMLAFAQYWNAPVTIVAPAAVPAEFVAKVN